MFLFYSVGIYFLHPKMGSSPAPFADIGKKAKGNLTSLGHCFSDAVVCVFAFRFPFIDYLYLKTCRSPEQGLHF